MNNRENQELQKKYNTSNSFQKQMNSISNKFLQFQQQAYYSQFGEQSKSMIIQIKVDSQLSKRLCHKQQINYYIFIGANQPNGNSCIEKTILNIINLLPRPTKTYSIIYINTNAPKNAYSDFKKVTQFLPKDYYVNLDKIYVLQASFVDKAMSWVSFNILTNFIKEKTVHLNQYRQLAEKTGLNAEQLLLLLPQTIQKVLGHNEEFVDHILTTKAMKMMLGKGFGKPVKSQNYQIFNKNQLIKAPQPDKKQYEQPINVSKSSIMFVTTKKATKRYIQEYKIGQTGAPLPLQILIYYFNNKDESLKTQGIFRKSVSIDDQNEILAEIDDENYDYIQTITDPHIIANAIKRFVSYLIAPVIPYPEFQKMMECKQQNLVEVVIEIVKNLSDVRKKTILILLQFFIQKIIPKENFNKMSIKNVCIVMGPCLMHSQVSSIKDLVYSQKIINVTYTIFKQFDNIFGSKKQRLLALRKSAKSFSRAEMEDRLGRNQSKINESNLKEAFLTPSQVTIIEQSQKIQKKQESKPMPSHQTEDHKLKLFHKLSVRMKEQMLQEDKNEQQEFYQVMQFEENKESNLSKNKNLMAYIYQGDLAVKQQDFSDI